MGALRKGLSAAQSAKRLDLSAVILASEPCCRRDQLRGGELLAEPADLIAGLAELSFEVGSGGLCG